LKAVYTSSGSVDGPTPRAADLASRVFENRIFALVWIVFLVLVLTFVGWPIRNALLVCWVYGTDGYFHQGIRVLPGKPIRFSDGSLAPQLADMVTGFGIFVATTLGLSLALFFALRFYDRRFAKPQKPTQQ
jgi:hypothetical protein